MTVPTEAEVLVVAAGTEVVRVHTLGPPHPLAWNELRSFGPTKSRFDHQTLPPRQQRRAIAYLAHGPEAFTAALAELFQDESGRGVGPIDTRRSTPAVTTFALARDVAVLDLGSGWVTRAGGNQAIVSGTRSTARAWARTIYSHHRRLVEGLAFPSSVWAPGRCLALWEAARDAFPRRPAAGRLLSDPAMQAPLAVAQSALAPPRSDVHTNVHERARPTTISTLREASGVATRAVGAPDAQEGRMAGSRSGLPLALTENGRGLRSAAMVASASASREPVSPTSEALPRDQSSRRWPRCRLWRCPRRRSPLGPDLPGSLAAAAVDQRMHQARSAEQLARPQLRSVREGTSFALTLIVR